MLELDAHFYDISLSINCVFLFFLLIYIFYHDKFMFPGPLNGGEWGLQKLTEMYLE